MNKWCFLFCLKSILCVNTLLAQDAFLFTKQTNLPSDIINAIAVEQSNIIWVATEEGLVELYPNDSGKFVVTRTFTNPKDPALFKAQQIVIDNKGQKWLGTYRSSLVKLNERNPLKSEEIPLTHQGKKQLITSLYFDSPTIWAGLESGLVMGYNTLTKRIEQKGKPTTNNIYSIYSEKTATGKKTITVGTTSGLYQKQLSPYQKQLSQWHQIPVTSNIKFFAALQNKLHRGVLRQTYKILDYQKQLWVIGQNQTAQANVQSWLNKKQPESYELGCVVDNQQTIFRDFDFDKKGNMWIVTDKQVIQYNPKKNECLQNIPLPKTLSKANTLVVQNTNAIWIGSEGNGLYQLSLTSEIDNKLAKMADVATTTATPTIMRSTRDFNCNQQLILPNLRFTRGKATYLDPIKANADLDTIVTYLQQHPTYAIELSGHTDGGTAYFAKQLSKSRVEKAKNYLINKGVGLPRIKTRLVGGLEPLSYSAEDKKRAKNRRVEVRVICSE